MKKLDFVSLQVRNLQESRNFYVNSLGFKVDHDKPNACVFTYQDGQSVFAIKTALDTLVDKELGNGVSLWFSCEKNIELTRQEFICSGVTTCSEVFETPFGRAIELSDLDGYKLTFIQGK